MAVLQEIKKKVMCTRTRVIKKKIQKHFPASVSRSVLVPFQINVKIISHILGKTKHHLLFL